MPEPSTDAPTTVAIVPHTHWDREWYLPFQAFRIQLVRLLDELLPMLERDLSYPRFLLDGQTAVLDDYLAVRPEAEETLRRLIASGRLSVGPWMILMDEFMVSGETLVRNLQLGMARAAELGGAMPVGYLPDMFGHVAQMPQLLRLARLEHAVVWRGVPSEVTRTAFWWEAPDGSRVRAEYLYGSYSNGRDLPDDAKQLVTRAHGYELELGPARLPGGDLLLMNGTDHQMPQPGLGRVVAEANELQDDYRFVVTSLPEYLATQPTEGLVTWRGELRSGARANVLMGVASNRVDVHRATAVAERALERRAEPMSALLLPAERYPAALLDLAWRKLVLNSAHDSSCACSHDEVVDQVVVRYREARQIGDGLAREALHGLAERIESPPGSTVVVNPTAAGRGGLVSAYVPGRGPVHFVGPDGETRPTQLVRTVGTEGFSAVVTGQKVRWVLELMRGPEFAGTRIGSVDRTVADDGTVELVFHGVHGGEPTLDLEELRDELLELAGSEVTFSFRVVPSGAREVIFDPGSVPGFGWATFTASEGNGPATAVTAEGRTLANEHLRVSVDATDGTFTLTAGTLIAGTLIAGDLTIAGLGRLVDGGDGGDTYNYSPPLTDTVIDRPETVTTTILDAGPVRARVLVESTYRWPTHAPGDAATCERRSEETADVHVRTTLELRTGERFLRVHTELDNRCRDHRLRAHFPLPAPVHGSFAECAFAVVERGLTAEGGPHEVGLPTFVSRRFVDCSDGRRGLALIHDGLLEYEVVGEPGARQELALTLLRATGYLSRWAPALRPNPAGPLDPLEGPQLQGHHVVDYAVLPHEGDWRAAALYDRADELLVPLERVRGGGSRGAHLPRIGQRLAVRGAAVSAVRREPGGLVVRVFNPSDAPGLVEIERDGAPATGWVVDLFGQPVESLEGALELRGGQIATLRLT